MGIPLSFYRRPIAESIDFFSSFYNDVKSNKSDLLKKLKSKYLFAARAEDLSMGTIMLMWCKKYVTQCKKNNLDVNLRNHIMLDFLNTLYLHADSFDEIFVLLFTNLKSRHIILDQSKQFGLTCPEIHGVTEEIMRYAFAAGLKYSNRRSGTFEKPVDFPLKTFGLCPCTARPLYTAMYMIKPQIVRLLLNFGARIPYEDICVCQQRRNHPIENILSLQKFILKNRNIDSEFAEKYRKKYLTCLYILQVDLLHHSRIWKKVLAVLQQFSHYEINKGIPSLKHICRTKLRFIMKISNSICKPHIWTDLGLPVILISYLNIDYQEELNQ